MDPSEYKTGETYTITLHDGRLFTGTCAWRRDMDRYDRSTGAYGSVWIKVLSDGSGHEVTVAPGPCYIPGIEPE